MSGLIDGLSRLIWLQGIIVCLVGAFFLLAAWLKQSRVTLPEQRRITVFLGLALVGVGLSEIAAGWARGLTRYLENGGAIWLGEAVLILRFVTVVLMAAALIDVLLTWARAQERERGN